MAFGLLAVALVGSVAHAIPAQVQRAEELAVPGTVVTATFPAVTTPGNVLIVVVNFADPNDPTLADDQGRKFTPLTPESKQNSFTSRLYIVPVPSPAPRSLTATATSADRLEVIAAEYSGLPIPVNVEDRVFKVGNSAVADCGPISTGEGSLLFASIIVAGSVTDSGTLITERSRFDGDFYGDAISTGGMLSFTPTMSGSWYCHFVSLGVSQPDAGVSDPDAGVTEIGTIDPWVLRVGSSCSSTPGLGWFVALSWFLRRVFVRLTRW